MPDFLQAGERLPVAGLLGALHLGGQNVQEQVIQFHQAAAGQEFRLLRGQQVLQQAQFGLHLLPGLCPDLLPNSHDLFPQRLQMFALLLIRFALYPAGQFLEKQVIYQRLPEGDQHGAGCRVFGLYQQVQQFLPRGLGLQGPERAGAGRQFAAHRCLLQKERAHFHEPLEGIGQPHRVGLLQVEGENTEETLIQHRLVFLDDGHPLLGSGRLQKPFQQVRPVPLGLHNLWSDAVGFQHPVDQTLVGEEDLGIEQVTLALLLGKCAHHGAGEGADGLLPLHIGPSGGHGHIDQRQFLTRVVVDEGNLQNAGEPARGTHGQVDLTGQQSGFGRGVHLYI